MKIVIQRVSQASVTIAEEVWSEINHGMLILLGIEHDDDDDDINWLIGKIISLRIFPDDKDVMNRSVVEVGGEIMVVSQFTLHASTKKGNRPSYIKAAKPEFANAKYEQFISVLEKEFGKKVGRGKFGADMKVSLINDGPVTIIIDSKNKE